MLILFYVIVTNVNLKNLAILILIVN